jgi:predicted nucleotidyltransferase
MEQKPSIMPPLRINECMDLALGSTTKVRILRFYSKHPEMELTKRELARLIGLSHTSVNAAVPDLVSIGLLQVKFAGRSHIYSVDKGSFLFEPLSNLFLAESTFTQEIIDLIKKELKGIGTCILFGSYARKEEVFPSSDLDILIITSSKAAAWEKINPLAEKVHTRYHVVLSPIVLSRSEFQKKKGQPVYKKAIHQGELLVREKGWSL